MVGKEELKEIEDIFKHRANVEFLGHRNGVWETSEVTQRLKKALASLASLEGIKVERLTTHDGRGEEIRVTVRIGFEIDGS